MHWTLTPKANFSFVLLWFVVGALSLWLLPSSARSTFALSGVILGTICGRLQADAMRLTGERLKGAQTARDVQQMLSSVGPGRAYRVIFYAGFAVIFVLSFGMGVRAPLAWIGSFCAFAFARDTITLPRVLALGK